MDSPYHPGFGARPAVLVGRERQIARAAASLTRVANSGQAAPSALVLTGARGLGKTVTLGVIRDGATERRFASAMVAFDSVSDNVRLLAGKIAESIAPLEGRSPELWTRFRQRLANVAVEINAGVVKIASPPPLGNGARSATTEQRQVLVDLLVGGARIAFEHGGSGLALFLDELQEAPGPHLVVIANAIQDALATKGVPLAVFAAGLPNTPEAVMAAASFTERFDFRVLDPLEPAAAERALLEPALAQRVGWDQDAADVVLQAAGGSPYLIQRMGDEAWVTAAPSAGGSIAAAHAAMAVADVSDSLGAGMFRGRWGKATRAEREYLVAVAQVVDAGGVAQTRHLTALTGKTTPQWSTVRKALIDKGLIASVSQGRLRFTMPGFAEFVRQLTEMPWYGPRLTDGSVTVAQLQVERPGLPGDRPRALSSGSSDDGLGDREHAAEQLPTPPDSSGGSE